MMLSQTVNPVIQAIKIDECIVHKLECGATCVGPIRLFKKKYKHVVIDDLLVVTIGSRKNDTMLMSYVLSGKITVEDLYDPDRVNHFKEIIEKRSVNILNHL